jgi:hypothetical protein
VAAVRRLEAQLAVALAPALALVRHRIEISHDDVARCEGDRIGLDPAD